MFPTLDQGLGILFAAIGIGILLFLAGKVGYRTLAFFGFSFQRPRDKTPQELEWDREDRRYAASLDHRQLEVAFVRYSEAAEGVVPMVMATGPANETLTAWFDLVAGAIATGLKKQPEDHHRVAIWADLGDPTSFRLLGCANHNRNKASIRQLSKEGTLGGHAWRSKSGEYLCVDIAKDRRFRTRSPAPRPYRSVFAVRVGEAGSPWGVMTIDAPRENDFSAADLAIIRRFARLVSAGASVAIAKYSPGAARQGPTEALPAPIVRRDGLSAAPSQIEEEHPDDQP